MGNEEGATKHEDKYNEIITGLKNGTLNKITFITGAGISTSAGIPDFRSKTGLFAQMQKKYNLSSPAQFFQINHFYAHPEQFYEFCKGFDIEKYKPTKTHFFMGFLCEKGLIKRIYTQNVDGLELKAGVPREKMVFAHGTVVEAGCPECMETVDIEKLKEYIAEGNVMYCRDCGKPIKPKVVFYGENLPQSFFDSFQDIYDTDLSFIMGTSLQVFPFGRLPYEVPKDAWRVLINRTRVGTIFSMNRFKFTDEYKKDYFMEGYTDEMVAKIIKDVGWEEEFEAYCKKFN